MGFLIAIYTVIVLAGFAIIAAIIAYSDPQTVLSRKSYAGKSISLMLFIVLSNWLLGLVVEHIANEIFRMFAGYISMMLMVLPLVGIWWSVHRCGDIGWSKWTCMIFAAPGFGFLIFWFSLPQSALWALVLFTSIPLILWLVLLFVPGKSEGGTENLSTLED